LKCLTDKNEIENMEKIILFLRKNGGIENSEMHIINELDDN